jgi:23S rRNA (adenine2030-N6)-methyltransferase
MNYRHAFHAGNFADCMKHSLLVWLLRALMRKPAGLFVLDTHAGIGRYDLTSGPAERTGEWRAGIGRLLEGPPEALADYVGLVRECGLYPGSPVLARALLRLQDRMACCELHPEDFSVLRRHFGRDTQVSVHHRDAWEAIGGLLPPPAGLKRGLVLIDPPYEIEGEFRRVAAALREGNARFGTGVFCAWYPVKHRTPVRAFHQELRDSGLRDVVAAELWLREPLDAARLNGCGLLLLRPPFGFEQAAQTILSALLERLGTGEAGAGISVERLADE